MKLIPYNALTATPWKNGGGITRELACYPAGASMSDFIWRVSIADVGQSGPFSSFPGIERIITLLDGDGMQLQFENGARHDLTTTLVPYAFRGEDALHAQLAGSPSRDFNLMWRRDTAHGSVEVLRETTSISVDATTLLFCATGEWQVGDHRLEQGDTLIIEADANNIALSTQQANSALLCVRIALNTN
jgi:environmental stress-induced protein Ves